MLEHNISLRRQLRINKNRIDLVAIIGEICLFSISADLLPDAPGRL